MRDDLAIAWLARSGDALARQDYVEEARRIVDPVLKKGTPIYEYKPQSWGPIEAEQKIAPPDDWNNPVETGESGLKTAS